MIQAPIRNASLTGVGVLSHSGEFTNQVTDVVTPGRILNVRMVRTYRSNSVNQPGLLGYGWFFNYDRRLETSGDDMIYHDGEGRTFKFKKLKNGYSSPDSLYCTLVQEGKFWIQKFRYGTDQIFEDPNEGGRMVEIRDKNSNTLKFSYKRSEILITDTFGRVVRLSIARGRIVKFQDFTNRQWEYVYDVNDRLIEVKQPATSGFPNGTSIRYGYDSNNRLNILVNARGQVFLHNQFDDQTGRVISQEHGNGVCRFTYEEVREGRDTLLKTTTFQKNGSKLIQEHNKNGHEVVRELFINNANLATIDRVAGDKNVQTLLTRSEYNDHGEIVKQEYAAGNSKKWHYSETEKDPRAKGNLISADVISSNNSDKSLTTKYEYESEYQLRTSETNPRGIRKEYGYDQKGNHIRTIYPNVDIQPVAGKKSKRRPRKIFKDLFEEFAYDQAGQKIRHRHTDGTVDSYFYYLDSDPLGARNSKNITNAPSEKGGLLAKVIKDTGRLNIESSFGYDEWGNQNIITDSKGRATSQRYNAMGKIESIVGREPYRYEVRYLFDEDYNQIEESKSFERNEYNAETQQTVTRASSYRELHAYNTLGNLIERRYSAEGKEIIERFVRDADENVIRLIQPLGNITDFQYDERNLLIGKRIGARFDKTGWIRYTYSLNGSFRSFTDSRGNETTYNFDGYHRQTGFKNPNGASKQTALDENGNVVKSERFGHPGKTDRNGNLTRSSNKLLEQIFYQYDALDRVFRTDRKWFSPISQTSSGRSAWDNQQGSVASLIEFGDNGLPVAVWNEREDILRVDYDGLGRVVRTRNNQNDLLMLEYDTNDNVTRVQQINERGNFKFEVESRYDELDRVIWQRVNDELPKTTRYNSLNMPVSSVEPSGIEIKYLQDGFGRFTGQYYEAPNPDGSKQKVARLREFDDNYRISNATDANGQKLTYAYNQRGDLSSVILPTGNAWHYEYDDDFRLTKTMFPDGGSVTHQYDTLGRLTQRRFISPDEASIKIEQLQYDGLDRIVSSKNGHVLQSWQYDSLSRVIHEKQGEHTVKYTYDAAGNIASVQYPGGFSARYTHDSLSRCTQVRDAQNNSIASYQYNSAEQLSKILFSKDALEATLEYDAQERPESIEYRWNDTKTLVDGCRYAYDNVGNMLHEIRLDEGETKGDCYFYDSARRLIKTRYDVEDINNQASKFESESRWEYHASGVWKRLSEFDSNGDLTKEQISTLTALNNYKAFGNHLFEYDETGQCIQDTTFGATTIGMIGSGVLPLNLPQLLLQAWRYEYDAQKRLIKAIKLDTNGNAVLTIEYEYDSQDRLILKTVTDASGNVTAYRYVWIGNRLAQEWVNGVLVKEYIYGAVGPLPTRMREHTAQGVREIDVVFNGRGFVTGLIEAGTRSVIQRLVTNGFGHTLPKEINGLPVPGQNRQASRGEMLSSVIAALQGFGAKPSPMDILGQHQKDKGKGFNHKMEAVFGHSPTGMQDYLTGNQIFGSAHGNSFINIGHSLGKTPYFPNGPKGDLYTSNLGEKIGGVIAVAGTLVVATGVVIGVILAAPEILATGIVLGAVTGEVGGILAIGSGITGAGTIIAGISTVFPGGTLAEDINGKKSTPPDCPPNTSCEPAKYTTGDGDFDTSINPRVAQRKVETKIWGNRTPVNPQSSGGGPAIVVDGHKITADPCDAPNAMCDGSGLYIADSAGMPGWLMGGSHPLLNTCQGNLNCGRDVGVGDGYHGDGNIPNVS